MGIVTFGLNLGKPVDIFPYPLPFRRGQVQVKSRRAPGHPGRMGNRRYRPCRRGSTVIARSRMCAAAQA